VFVSVGVNATHTFVVSASGANAGAMKAKVPATAAPL
jgi:hypothetical protein